MATSTEDVTNIFQELGTLERSFAEVEIDALRRKEQALKPLYARRNKLLSRVPDFWPTVFGNGPEDVRQFISPNDLQLLSSITSFSVERYQIKSETDGEPRSLRFTFEFADNDIIEDKKLVKEFEYHAAEAGPGSMVSKPVAIKFKNKKKDLTSGLLNAAAELYQAEEVLKLKSGDDKEINIVDREALWQYEKLREKLSQLDEDADMETSFFAWFGFRGAVNATDKGKSVDANGLDGAEEEDEDDDEFSELLEVEVFPAGEEVAIALAEELWPDAIDYFVSAQEEVADDFDGMDEGEPSDDENAPELVEVAEDEDEDDADQDRPHKKQRKA
ncbi:hypothetical protein PV10_06755 [Exophiala mesophila]|uniref:BSD domain-containing protein n=1 Tax=Exophiala mesophila TaxID=212818 RepID=A0A0D1ZZQ2_EXOME|nr:uncharacterized protein PV10_06755 [Exophiala mesophila]KIV92303.1 hypothetical protein PV10_06755 [Exophiala mesophila]